MPTYVYECDKCGDEFELYQSFSDEPLKKHPGCGGKVAKVFQPVGIVLKGSGFYKNDSRSGSKRSNGSSTKSDSSADSSLHLGELVVRLVVEEDRHQVRREEVRFLVVGLDEEEVRLVDVDRQVVVVSAPAHFPTFPLIPSRGCAVPDDPGKDPSCPDALPARSRSGARRPWSPW